jgi:hypothetical protein
MANQPCEAVEVMIEGILYSIPGLHAHGLFIDQMLHVPLMKLVTANLDLVQDGIQFLYAVDISIGLVNNLQDRPLITF